MKTAALPQSPTTRKNPTPSPLSPNHRQQPTLLSRFPLPYVWQRCFSTSSSTTDTVSTYTQKSLLPINPDDEDDLHEDDEPTRHLFIHNPLEWYYRVFYISYTNTAREHDTQKNQIFDEDAILHALYELRNKRWLQAIAALKAYDHVCTDTLQTHYHAKVLRGYSFLNVLLQHVSPSWEASTTIASQMIQRNADKNNMVDDIYRVWLHCMRRNRKWHREGGGCVVKDVVSPYTKAICNHLNNCVRFEYHWVISLLLLQQSATTQHSIEEFIIELSHMPSMHHAVCRLFDDFTSCNTNNNRNYICEDDVRSISRSLFVGGGSHWEKAIQWTMQHCNWSTEKVGTLWIQTCPHDRAHIEEVLQTRIPYSGDVILHSNKVDLTDCKHTHWVHALRSFTTTAEEYPSHTVSVWSNALHLIDRHPGGTLWAVSIQ
eukprot:PhF_6_TR17055/c0_g1_i4/m.26024